MLGLVLLAILLKSLVFEPVGIWPAAFVCLLPWILVITSAGSSRRVYFYSLLFGLAFFLLNLRWLYEAHKGGYVALAVYLALFFPIIACPIRHLSRRRRWPMALAFPIIWTAGEIARATFLTGFPWFFLSHGLYKVLLVIQISDVVGAYGVSFLAASVNGAVADLILARLTAGGPAGRPRQSRFSILFPATITVVVLGYGFYQLQRSTMSEGPRIAVFQGDYYCSAYEIPEEERVGDAQKMTEYLAMVDAAATEQPDLFLLPESPWRMYLNAEVRDSDSLSKRSFVLLQEAARIRNASIITGSATLIQTPKDVLSKYRIYNSATIFTPDGAEPQRYDKRHLVPFGEAVPFRFGALRPLYLWLNRMTPFSGPDGTDEFSLWPGEAHRVFVLKASSMGDRTFRFGIPICYEDVMPYVSREFVSRGAEAKQADFLLNISNDGWFGRGGWLGRIPQQRQHLAISVFRAVENRVGIARAVNTGVSGFIRPSGELHDLVQPDPNKRIRANSGWSVANIDVDSRYSLYSRYGDWLFAWPCLLVGGVVYLDYFAMRFRRRPRSTRSKNGE